MVRRDLPLIVHDKTDQILRIDLVGKAYCKLGKLSDQGSWKRIGNLKAESKMLHMMNYMQKS